MEKLQKAIAQARAERQELEGVAKPAPKAAAAETAQPEASTWDSIRKIDINARHLRRQHVLSHDPGSAAVPFDVMRTKIMQMMRQNEWKRLLITSPTPQCGKTTLSANMAFGLARQGEYAASLLEFDLRRPGLANMIGFTPERDVRDMLLGDASFEDQAVRIGDRVTASCAKTKAQDPSRILNSTKTIERLQDIEDRFSPDIMIFDTPPLLVNDDTRSLLPIVDCVVLIARAEVTTSNQIDQCEREIAEATNMMGVILNQCQFDNDSSKYGYGYY